MEQLGDAHGNVSHIVLVGFMGVTGVGQKDDRGGRLPLYT